MEGNTPSEYSEHSKKTGVEAMLEIVNDAVLDGEEFPEARIRMALYRLGYDRGYSDLAVLHAKIMYDADMSIRERGY